MRGRRRWLGAIAAAALALAGCGGGGGSEPSTASSAKVPAGARTPSTHRLLAVGSKVRDCDIVFAGSGHPGWRRRSLAIGPLGLAGREGPDFDVGDFEDGLLSVKTPTLIAGHRPVTISIPPAQRYRAAILGVHPRPAYASVTYVPCAAKPRTVFAAGFLLRDRRPLTLLVKVGDGPTRGLYLRG